MKHPQPRTPAEWLKVIVPFIQKTYPVQVEAAGRLLLGFSKSGWGAFSWVAEAAGLLLATPKEGKSP